MSEFSLSDMEEVWRQRKDGKTLQAKIERFAERLDSFRFTFLLIVFSCRKRRYLWLFISLLANPLELKRWRRTLGCIPWCVCGLAIGG